MLQLICCYAEFLIAECSYAKCLNAECHYTEYSYAECRCAVSQYSESRGAKIMIWIETGNGKDYISGISHT